MIPSQRHLFNIPNDIVYFNTAYMSPLLKSVVKAIGAGTRLKETPWKIKTPDFFENVDIVRNLFASLLNVLPENIAIIPSASYGKKY
jgi:selenocysteine lyase/cysteine desulfurase